MNGGRCSTTRIWRPPSSTASWSADGSFASMDPRDELVISSWRTPCQAVPNGSEYLEYVAQNFRNPHLKEEILAETTPADSRADGRCPAPSRNIAFAFLANLSPVRPMGFVSRQTARSE